MKPIPRNTKTIKNVVLFLGISMALSQSLLADSTDKTTPNTKAKTQKLKAIDTVGVRVHTGTFENTLNIGDKFLSDTQASTIRDITQADSSLEVGGGSQIASKLYIRGLEEQMFNVSVDGITQGGNSFHHQGSINLNPAIIKSITVQKGYASPESGPGALVGSVKVETKNAFDMLRGSKKKYGAILDLGAFSNFGLDGSAAVYGILGKDGILGKTGIMLYYSKQYMPYYRAGETIYGPRGFINPKDRNQKVQSSKNNSDNLVAKITTQLDEKNSFEFTYNFMTNNTITPFAANVIIPTESPLFNNDLFNNQGSFKYEYDTDKFKANWNTYYSQKKLFLYPLDGQLDEHSTATTEAEKEEAKEHDDEVRPLNIAVQTAGSDLVFTNTFGKDQSTIKYGLNYQLIYQSLRNSFVSTPHDHTPEATSHFINRGREFANVIGGFVSLNYYILDSLALEAGSRYDFYNYVDKFNQVHNTNNVSPSVALVYTPLDGLDIKLSYAYSMRGAKPTDASLLYSVDANIDPKLKSEQAQNTELDINYGGEHFNLRGSAYYQNIHNFINTYFNTNPSDEHAFLKTNMPGFIEILGYEVAGKVMYGGFSASLGVSQQFPFYKGHYGITDSFELGAFTGAVLTANLNYDIKDWGLSFGWLSRIVLTTGDFNAYNLYFNVLESYQKVGYDVHNLYINYTPPKHDNLTLRLAFTNIVNRLYINPASPRKEVFANPSDGDVASFPIYEPGFNVKFSLSYKI
ncbi:hypothetical protein BKH43_01125 [Helicobacter sp. 13S00401-1]|uniref:TonB-dependent receptor domain-containing protein n=1 Tax=Helicobacter sp. 13S00401-1 TaxID=1905758 RepID=UPI000BA6E9EE|nr:TonB-dependent receptor [Helicobacter sp. 13S00401-1]PAF51866.1 hypothetical protein BKH43_01125 [Helicobacter sp. 13S00401-1]